MDSPRDSIIGKVTGDIVEGMEKVREIMDAITGSFRYSSPSYDCWMKRITERRIVSEIQKGNYVNAKDVRESAIRMYPNDKEFHDRLLEID